MYGSYEWRYAGGNPSLQLGSSGPQRVMEDPDPDVNPPRIRGFNVSEVADCDPLVWEGDQS